MQSPQESTWRQRVATTLHIKDFEDETILIYEENSGDIHAMSPIALMILEEICHQEKITTSSLHQQIIRQNPDLGISEQQVAKTLLRLWSAGLIERCHP